jgi:hypothetical protein
MHACNIPDRRGVKQPYFPEITMKKAGFFYVLLFTFSRSIPKELKVNKNNGEAC